MSTTRTTTRSTRTRSSVTLLFHDFSMLVMALLDPKAFIEIVRDATCQEDIGML